MPNTFPVANWVAMRTMGFLKGQLGIVRALNNSYEGEYKKDFKPGATINVELPHDPVPDETTSLQFNGTTVNNPTTTLTMNMFAKYHVTCGAMDLTLGTDRARFDEKYIQPGAIALAHSIEKQVIAWITPRINNVTGALGTTPTSIGFLTDAKVRFQEHMRTGKKYAFITPEMMAKLAATQQTLFHPGQTVKDAFSDVEVTKGLGFERIQESNLLTSATAGVWGTPASVTVKGASQSGSSILVNCTNGDTFKAGDVITFASVYNVDPRTKTSTGRLKQFTILADAVGASSEATLSIYPAITGPSGGNIQKQQNVDALPANTAVLTLWPGTTAPSTGPKSGKIGLALHRDAFLFASVPLEKPGGGAGAQVCKHMTDPETGVTILVTIYSDYNTLETRFRMDCMFGLGVGQADSAAVKLASGQ